MPVRHPASLASPGWTIVVPFKGGTAAKTRLGHGCGASTGLAPGLRRQLALAFLRDTVAAAAAVPAVAAIAVVSSDPAVATALPGTFLLPDPGHGLNAAAAAGIAWARTRDHQAPTAVLTADLPCLRPPDLAAALDLARQHPLALVPDRHGTGTTLISALPGIPVTPHFGPHSRQAHHRAGHTLLPVPAESTLRADVDTPADLARALRHGVGMSTEFAAARHRGLPPTHRPVPLPAAV